MDRLRNQWILALTVLLIVIGLAGMEGHAGVIMGYVQDRGGNMLNGAIIEYWRQECACFATQCGSSARLIDYTGPSPYGHSPGQFYTINVQPGRYNVKVTYNGIGYDNMVTNVPITSCNNSNVQGPFTITLPIGGSSCSYRSLQARVQATDSSPWAASTTIQRGQRVHLATFHDDSGQLTACCTSMRFSGPGLDTAVSNLQWVTPPQTGTYTLRSTCGTVSATATVTVNAPPPACPYASLQARVQGTDSSPWAASTTIQRGQRVRVAAFRDNSGQLTTCCTSMQFSGPGLNASVSNLQYITPPQTGTYTLRITCDTRTDTATVTVTDSGACSYSTIQARVQKDGGGWDAFAEINFGDRIRLGAFDGSGQPTGCCTTLRFSGPDGMDGPDRIDTVLSNQQWFTPPMGGAYRLDVSCGSRTDTALVFVWPNYRFGLNTNNLLDDATAIETAKHFQRLGAGLARVEIINSRPPEFWSRVVDQFNSRGIAVLAVLSNQTWNGGARDPRADACASGDRRPPSEFGTRLVTEFIPSADPYVQRLKDRVSFWELWNEAGSPNTQLCPENYAYLLTEAKLRWPDIGYIGASLESQGRGTSAASYLFDLAYQTDKSLWSLETRGDLPWDILMHHPYPGEDSTEGFVSFQTSLLYDVVSWIPIWFTEIGWYGQGGEGSRQADMLQRAYNAVLANDAVGVMFWFSLYDCVPHFGLIDNCSPNGPRRQSYSAYRRMASGGRLQ